MPAVSDVGAIVEEMQRSNAAAVEQEHLGPSVATLNLIVYVDDGGYREWVLERAGLLAAKHPSRLIVLDATRDDGQATVTTSTSAGGGTTVVSQRIDLAVGVRANAGVVTSLLRDLTVADTPTVLWWSSANMVDDPLLDALAPMATTVVVDSSGAERGEEALKVVASFLAAHGGAAVRDLAYMRLMPWQEMIAQFFDEPALFEDLFSIERLDIAAGSDAEIGYLAGWLGSRLSWTVRDHDTFVARDGKAVPLTRERVGERRRVARVQLASAASTYTAELCEDETVVCLSVSGAGARSPWYTPLPRIDNTSLLERATMDGGHDPIFEVTVETVRALVG